MIQLSGAGKRYRPQTPVRGTDWLITPKDRIGLVGANGTGKSTLMKILGGWKTSTMAPSASPKGSVHGYLPQDGLTLSRPDCLCRVHGGVRRTPRHWSRRWKTLPAACQSWTRSPEYTQVADRYHRIDHEFRTRDGYAIEAQVGTVLSGLGFGKEDWARQTEEFSGGWQMRMALAKLLLQKPNLLLLDEPTNHLDLEARNWLEEYLGNYPFAFVLISHDRYFLDVTVNKIVEIWNKRIHFYPGNYEKYLAQKTQRRNSWRPPTKTNATASSNWKYSSTASATGDQSQTSTEPD